ncbi:transposase-like zinc-binding domain-containing protein [Nostoc sp.]|uniref:transposase-like zinc-binding domain-containing protein n=1 Tax=Nostoc sp. TaxID=1180 RepID=UPI003FA5BE4A
MNCPYCASNLIRKNGHRRGKQNYMCVSCDVRSTPLTPICRITFKTRIQRRS